MSFDKIKCRFCYKSYKDPQYYSTHLKKVHGNNEPVELVDQEIIALQAKHMVDKGRYICNTCGNKYSSPYVLKEHQKKKRCKHLFDLIDFVKNTDNPAYLLKVQNIVNNKLTTIKNENSNNIINSNNRYVNLHDHSQANIDQSINNINIQINLNPVGHERVEGIEDLLIEHMNDLEIIEGDGSLEVGSIFVYRDLLKKLFSHLYANDDFPDNHNMYVTNNKKEKPFLVYKNVKGTEKWVKDGDINLLVERYHQVVTILKQCITKIDLNSDRREKLLSAIEYLESTYNNVNKKPLHRSDNICAKKYHDILYQERNMIIQAYDQIMQKERLAIENE